MENYPPFISWSVYVNFSQYCDDTNSGIGDEYSGWSRETFMSAYCEYLWAGAGEVEVVMEWYG